MSVNPPLLDQCRWWTWHLSNATRHPWTRAAAVHRPQRPSLSPVGQSCLAPEMQ